MNLIGRLRCVFIWVVLFIALGFVWYTQYLGIDFGNHFDEWYLPYGLKHIINEMVLLPHEYNYGGMYFNIGIILVIIKSAPFIPGIIHDIATNPEFYVTLNHDTINNLKQILITMVESKEFLIENRLCFVTISLLTPIFVFVTLCRIWGDRQWSCLAGALYVAFSWEAAYQSRFVATDSLLMTFTALTFCLIAYALKSNVQSRILWGLFGAAVAAGFGVGSKITGVFLILPILFAWFIHRDRPGGLRYVLSIAGALIAVFLGTFIITTPGALLDFFRFANGILIVSLHYRTSYGGVTDYPFYAANPFDYLSLSGIWMLLAVPSPLTWAAVPVSLISLYGVYVLAREHTRFFLCIAIFFVIYAGFGATTHVLYIRNFIPVIPLLALAFGSGVGELATLLKNRTKKQYLAAAVSGVFLYNGYWLFYTANTIAKDDMATYVVSTVRDYMANHSSKAFVVDPELLPLLKPTFGKGIQCWEQERAAPSQANDAIMFPIAWMANRYASSKLTVGSLEVNYDYYPVWEGYAVQKRVIVINRHRAEASGYNIWQSPITPKKISTANWAVCQAKNAALLEPISPPALTRDCPTCPAMIEVPTGTFMMGLDDGAGGWELNNEFPSHQVTITKRFMIGKYPVTQSEYLSVMGSNPSSNTGDLNRPVEMVSWKDAQSFVKKLTDLTGQTYRLPTEAEWELAARGGKQTPYFFSDETTPPVPRWSAASRYAWSEDIARGTTHPVGLLWPNPFGLYDVYGNVWQWVQDCAHTNYIGAPGDGSAWDAPDCKEHILRGGSWVNSTQFTRSAARSYGDDGKSNGVGFRVVREISP